MYQQSETKPNLRIVLDNTDNTVVHNIEYELETNFANPVIVHRSYVVYADNAIIDLSTISFNGDFGRDDICRFSFEQDGRFYTIGAFRVHKNRTIVIINDESND